MSKTHGTRYSYTAGCRCDECRQANTTYMARYRRDRPKPTAWRNKRPWEPWEDDIVRDYSKSAWQIAETLERTPAAVGNRRRVLCARAINQGER